MITYKSEMDFTEITHEQKLRILMEEVPRMNMKWAEEKLETIRQRERAEALEKTLEHERYMRKEAEMMVKDFEALLEKMMRDNSSATHMTDNEIRKLKLERKCREMGIPVENKSVHELRSEIVKMLHGPDCVVTVHDICDMDKKMAEDHCRDCGFEIEGKSRSELHRQLIKVTRYTDPVPAPSPVEVCPAPSPVEACPAPSPVEACPAPVGSIIDVDEEPTDVTKARIVMTAYNKLLVDVLISPVRDAKLLCAHAENLGVEVKHQKREQLVEEMRVALAAGAQLSNPVKLLKMYEKRLVELADFAIQKHKQPTINVNASTLRTHCKHYALADDFTLSCLNKDQLYDLLLGKLRA